MSQPGPIFVTGGSGFVGRHIVQQLARSNYKVRLLARRIPPQGFDASVEPVIGDLSKPETYASALQGAGAVVHAALTDDLSHEPQATLALQNLSARAGVHKFIHLSSIVIYGSPASGIITEETSPLPSTDLYSRTKLEIEEALRASSGVPKITILRLGCVYGPGGGWWSQSLLNQMQRGRLILVNGGKGTANLIHSADVAGAILLALTRSASPLDVFNVTDGTPVTWKRYYSELETILGRTATVSMTTEEARGHGRKWIKPSLARRVVRKITGGQLVYPLDDRSIQEFTSSAVYTNRKAVDLLGFKPIYNLEKGTQTVATFYHDSARMESQKSS